MTISSYSSQGCPTIRVTDVAFHRNGVSGRGFFVVAFNGKIDGETRCMIAIRPSAEPKMDVECFVLDVNDVSNGNIQTAWRGDHFNKQVDQAIDDFKMSWCWPPKEAGV